MAREPPGPRDDLGESHERDHRHDWKRLPTQGEPTQKDTYTDEPCRTGLVRRTNITQPERPRRPLAPLRRFARNLAADSGRSLLLSSGSRAEKRPASGWEDFNVVVGTFPTEARRSGRRARQLGRPETHPRFASPQCSGKPDDKPSIRTLGGQEPEKGRTIPNASLMIRGSHQRPAGRPQEYR